MTDIHEFFMDPDSLESGDEAVGSAARILNKQRLLEIGDKYEASIAANRKQDAQYHR